MRTIAIANQKGGCGKTTTAVNLSAALAQLGYKTLIVDLDSQACTTGALNGEPDAVGATIYHSLVDVDVPLSAIVLPTRVKDLDLVPSNVSLAAAEMELIGQAGRELRLARAFRTVRDNYKVCVIDCPPSLGVLTLNALVASTDVIVPIQVDSYALKCAQRLLETILIVRQRFHRYCAGNLRILLTYVDDKTALGKRTQRQMRELFGDLVLKTVIHRTVVLAESLAAGEAAATYSPSSAAAAEYLALAEEMVRQEGAPMEEESLLEVAAMAQNALGARYGEIERASATADLLQLPMDETQVQEPEAISLPEGSSGEMHEAVQAAGLEGTRLPASKGRRRRTPERTTTPRRPLEGARRVPVPSPGEARQPSAAEAPKALEPQAAPAMATTAGFLMPKPEPTMRQRRRRKRILVGAIFMFVLALVAGGTILALKLVNVPPVATSGDQKTPEDTTLKITLAANDRNRDHLTYHIVKDPSHGQLSGTLPDVVYRPAPNYNGPDSFTFVANDGKMDSEPATISIQVTPVNDIPVAIAQSVKVDDNKPAALSLKASDADADRLTFSIVSPPKQGTLAPDPQFASDGKLVYTPRTGYVGPDSFTFKVNDGTADSGSATMSLDVAHVNNPPVAGEGAVTTQEDTPVAVTLSATDPDNDTLAYVVTKGPENGTLSGTAPNLRYAPKANFHGADAFTYEIRDGKGGTAVATMTIQVSPVNDAPMIGSEPKTAAVAGRKYTYDVNATDVDKGDTLTYSLLEKPAEMTIDSATGRIQWVPTEAQMGSHNVVVQVTDNGVPPASGKQSFDVNVGARTTERTILTASGGYDQKSRKAISAADLRRVEAADDEAYEIQAGSFAVFNFAQASVPEGAKISSVVLYVRHLEAPQFPSGNLEWKVGAGWPASPSPWVSLTPSVYDGQRNKGTLAWDLNGMADTPERLNTLQLQIKNNCTAGQKSTFIDRVYLVVVWQ